MKNNMHQNSLNHLNRKGWVRILGGFNNVISTKITVKMSEIGASGGVNLIKKEKKIKLDWNVLNEISKKVE
jgi:hypothetical protein